MRHRSQNVGTALIFFALSFLLLFMVRLANASRVLLGEASRYAQASMSVVKAREIRRQGIPVRVELRDGSSREFNIFQVSLGLNEDESFEFFRLPTTKQIVDSYIHGTPLPKEEVVNRHALTQLFTQSLSGVLHSPTDAHYVYAKGKTLIADDAPGQSISMENVVAQILRILQEFDVETITIKTTDIPARVQTQMLEQHKDLAGRISSSKGFLLTRGAYAWNLSGATLVEMLTYASSSPALVVDEGKLYAHIKTLAHSLISEPLIEPQFGVKDGRLIVMHEGRPGFDIDVRGVAITINEWIHSKQVQLQEQSIKDVRVRIELKNLTTMPRYSLAELERQGIGDLIGTAKTSFKGSSMDRIHNISLGASRVSGFLVQPGEEFSLVQGIGYAEKENGYKEEYVIKGDRSRKEAGGGLCQVATTFFRAALNAGLNITERHNHRYVVGYYGPGLDAGIYAIDHDFRFVNDFSAPLLVQVQTKGTELIVEFFGRSDKRTSVTTKPLITDVLPPPPPDFRFSKTIPFGKTECTDRPREGMTSYATTTIRYQSGEVRNQLWKSTYAPWPKICLIGTGGLDIYQQED